MTSVIRAAAIAAAMAAFSWGVVAAPVTFIPLDFTSEGADADKAKEPLAVQSAGGVFFQNAWAYGPTLVGGNYPNPRPPAGVNFGGYLANRSSPSDTADIILSLDDLALQAARVPGVNAFPGQFLTKITFNMFTLGGTPTMTYTDAAGVTKSKDLTPGNDELRWSLPITFTFDAAEEVRMLRFIASEEAVLGLDNMDISLTEGGGTVTVPEPASYALVGLALLAAGTARRRRA